MTMPHRFGKKTAIPQEDVAGKFVHAGKKRDLKICEKCEFLHRHEDGTFGCGNVFKAFGHPWCAESRQPLPGAYFEKATIFIADREKCLNHSDSAKCEDEKR